VANYTTLSGPDVASILVQYPIRANRTTPLPGGAANSSYLIQTDSLPYVLTVLDNHDHASAGQLAAMLAHLSEHRIPTSRLVRTSDHAELASFDERPVLVKEFVEGRCDGPLPDGAHGPAGELLARVHAVPVPQWLPTGGRRMPADWTRRVDQFADREFAAWLRDQWRLASTVDRLDGPYGLVHGDYFADNLVVRDGGQLAVLDWETATHDLLVLDIGMAIVGLCRGPGGSGEFLPARAVELLRGYDSVRPLSRDERGLLRDAVRYASLVTAYHRYLRHHLTHPDQAKWHLYREIPRFVHSLDELWPGVPASGGRG
jgi:homoserine kinase type II